MIPTIGRIVIYRLSGSDANEINRRRTTRTSIADRIKAAIWPEGVQAHIGNPAMAGQEFPMIIVAIDPMSTGIRGQVFLDGNDVLWIRAERGFNAGDWRWPGDAKLDDTEEPRPKNRPSCF